MANQQINMEIDESAGSNPRRDNSSFRIQQFLKTASINAHSESISTDTRIIKLKAQKKKLRENIKKTKQRITEQIEKLRLFEQEMDNIELNISNLQKIRDKEDETDV
jgi:seryl-tRNA synthetase